MVYKIIKKKALIVKRAISISRYFNNIYIFIVG